MCDGIYLSCLIPIVLEIANCPKLANQLSGYYHSFISIPVMLGPALSGLFFEYFLNYTYAFYLGGSCCLCCSIILLFNPATLIEVYRNLKNVSFLMLFKTILFTSVFIRCCYSIPLLWLFYGPFLLSIILACVTSL
jgi:hypothetical protein